MPRGGWRAATPATPATLGMLAEVFRGGLFHGGGGIWVGRCFLGLCVVFEVVVFFNGVWVWGKEGLGVKVACVSLSLGVSGSIFFLYGRNTRCLRSYP